MNYLEDSIAIPVVVGLVEAFKVAGLPTKFAPLLSVILGVVYSIGAIVVSAQTEQINAILKGVIIGLVSSGLYSGVKATIKNPIQ